MTVSDLLQLNGAYKHYRSKKALAPISLTLQRGNMLALLGHNGAGKSTLIKLICGLIKPSGGHIQRWQAGGEHWQQRLGYLPENIRFNGRISGIDTLRFFARLKKIDARHCGALLEQVGLTAEDRLRPVGEYSKGMRQRLGLAQALLGNPLLLLLDEPTSGLDPTVRRDVYQLLSERAAKGCSIVISSHSLDEIEYRCSDFLILRDGQLVAHNSREQLLRQARLPIAIKIWSRAFEQIRPLLNGYAFEAVDHDSAIVSCPPESKLRLLAHLSGCQAVDNLAIHEPRLSELYVKLNNGGLS